MSLPRVAIIIVNWNGKADTLECLTSLRQDNYANKEIIIVDNGSQDDSVASIRASFPDVTVLETGKNLGFTGGNNVGIRYALEHDVDYVYLLNNDTTVEADALTALVKTGEANPIYGILTPIIYYFDQPKEAWFGGATLDIKRGIAIHDNGCLPEPTDRPTIIPWATGCATLIRAELIQQLGGFDDRYYLYWEDVDLSLRVSQAGYQIVLVPSARIYHKCGHSSSMMSASITYYSLRNHLLLVSTHGGSSSCYANIRITARAIRTCLSTLRRKPKHFARQLTYLIQAVVDHVHGNYGPLRVVHTEFHV